VKESQASRFADLLEGIARKARALTVDRLARGITLTALGLGAAALILVAFVLACVGIFRLLTVGLGATAAYAVLGGLSLAAGWFFWRKRVHIAEEPHA